MEDDSTAILMEDNGTRGTVEPMEVQPPSPTKAPNPSDNVQEPDYARKCFFDAIAVACVGSDESRRAEVLSLIASDSAISGLLPQLFVFITEGVRMNVCSGNILNLSIVLMIVEALLKNPYLPQPKLAQNLMPHIITCAVNKQISEKLGDQWNLRNNAARLVAQICTQYATVNNLQTRVTRVLSKYLFQANLTLPSMYGCIASICLLGKDVIDVVLRPHVKFILERVRGDLDYVAAKRILGLLEHLSEPLIKIIDHSCDEM